MYKVEWQIPKLHGDSVCYKDFSSYRKATRFYCDCMKAVWKHRQGFTQLMKETERGYEIWNHFLYHDELD